MGALDDLISGGGGSSRSSSRPSGGSGGALDNLISGGGGGGGSRQSSPPAAPHHNPFSSIIHGAGQVVHNVGADAGMLASSVPRGLAKFAWQAPQDLAHVGEVAVGARPKATQLPGESFSAAAARSYPAFGGMFQSMADTGSRLMHPTRLAHDYAQHPLASLVNDAANLSIILGPVAEATGGAGKAAEAGAAGGRVAKAADVVNKIATAPVDVYKLPFKAPGALGRLAESSLAKEAAATAAGETGVNAFKGARVLAKLGPAEQSVKSALSSMKANVAYGRTAPDKVRMQVDKLLSPDEHAAMIEADQGGGHSLALERASLVHAYGPDDGAARFAAHVEQRTKGTLTPAAANMAADLAEGKNPELAAKIRPALDLYRQAPLVRGGQQARSEAFYAQPGHEWQAGFEPNARGVSEAVRPLQDKLVGAERDALRARAAADQAAVTERAARADQNIAAAPLKLSIGGAKVAVQGPDAALASGERVGRLGEQAAQADRTAGILERNQARLARAVETKRSVAEQDLTNQPSRLRPAIGEAIDAQKQMVAAVNDLHQRGLHDDAKAVENAIGALPTTGKLAGEFGIDPYHWFHTQEAQPRGTGGSGKTLAIPGNVSAGSEKLRTGSAVYDRTSAGQARGAADLNRVAAMRAAADRIGKLPVAARLGEGVLAGAHTAEDAARAGYKPMPGFNKAGQLTEVDTRLGLAKDTPFLPTPVVDAFRSYFTGPGAGSDFARVVGSGNRAFYMTRLAFNPAFIANRILGHGVIAGMSTSSLPRFGANLLRAVAEWKRSGGTMRGVLAGHDQGEFPAPAEVTKSTMTGSELERMNAEQGRGGKISRALGAPGRAVNRASGPTFRVAAFMDNVQRSAFYMTEHAKRGSAEAAVEATLRSLGDFNRMTPFEQNVVRQYIPMYAWHKEITLMAFHLAEDHPLRVAWTLHLADVLGKPQQPLSSFNQATVPVGNTLVGTSALNPFAQVTDYLGGGLGGVGKLLGPVPRLLANKLTGQNVSTGKPWFMPPGTSQTNRQTNGPSILNQIESMVPQKRLFDALTGRDQIARYANGQPYVPTPAKGGVPQFEKTGSTRLQGVSSFFGVPLANKRIAEATEARTEAKKLSTTSGVPLQKLNYGRKITAAKTKTRYVPIRGPRKPKSSSTASDPAAGLPRA